jgi:hypothetical protein
MGKTLLTFEEDDTFVDIFQDIDLDTVENSISEDVDLEKLVLAVRNIREEVVFLKDLKKRRVAPIAEKLEKLERNEEELKSLILELMPELFPKKKTVDFPGIGKITKRTSKGKWEVTDEEELLQYARSHDKHKELFDRKFVLKKRELASVLADIIKDDGEDPEGVMYVDPDSEFSLTVTLAKDED